MITIRRMEKRDVSEVAFLEGQYFSNPWSEKSFSDAVCSDDTLYLVAEKEGRVTGYCGFYLSYESADLCNMLVEEKMRKKGIALKLLNTAFPVLQNRHVARILLEVRKTNLHAIGLYEKSGFQKIGIRKAYYADPREDAVLMEKNF